MKKTTPVLSAFLGLLCLSGSIAFATESSARFDRHDILYRSRDYLRTSQYLARNDGKDVLITWGWRILEFPVGRNVRFREVVAEQKDDRFSNGATAFDVGNDGNDELVLARYRRDNPTEQNIVWYEQPADPKARWIEHLIATVPGTDMPHDIQPISIPLAGGPPLRGIIVSIHRKDLYLFEPGEDPRQPWHKYAIGSLPDAPQSGMAVGDLNGDGRPDIVSGMFWVETPADPRTGTWTIRRYATWDKLNNPWGGMNKHAIADFDGDGQAELAINEAESPGSRLAIFKRDPAQPDGLWTSRTIDTGLDCPHTMATTDLDEDGRPDLIVGEMEAGGWSEPLNATPHIYGYLNRGGGRFDRVTLAEGFGAHEGKIASRKLSGRTIFYTNSTYQEWHDGMIAHLSLWTIVPVPPGQLLRDDFDESLAAGWSWLREDTNAWMVRRDGLHLSVLPGTLWGKPNDARNVLLRPAPTGDFAAEVSVENAPGVPSEQAGLLLYGGDDAYIKLVKEMVKDGSIRIVFAREEGGKAKVVRDALFPAAKQVRLRLSVAGGKVRAQFRAPDASDWQDLAECDPVPAPELRVGLAAHVTGTSDRMAHFTRFELSAPVK